MTFEPTEAGRDHAERLADFIATHIEPNQATFAAQSAENEAAGRPHVVPQIIEDLKPKARDAGLWNLFHPELGNGLSNLDYAPLAEQMGRTGWGPEVFNCAAPDTGNMEILHLFGTDAQKERYLQPLLDGEIRSAFAMTEPAVASSDATNIESSIRDDGDSWVIDGTKWFISGAADPRCEFMIFMGKTDPDAPSYTQQSMVLIPMDTPGVTVVRNMEVFGYTDQHGHCEITFEGVRVPKENLLGEPGSGFAIAQARLGPGRIHHCMRAIGVAERALELMCRRTVDRVAFGRPLADQGVVREWIADSRIEIEQSRLLTLKAAHLIDTVGARGAAIEISAIKVAVPNMALRVVDRAIQAFGAAGVSQDFPLARMYAGLRTLRLADGPDEVHRRQVARRELAQYRS